MVLLVLDAPSEEHFVQHQLVLLVLEEFDCDGFQTPPSDLSEDLRDVPQSRRLNMAWIP